MPKKDTDTIVRETHVMTVRICQRLDKIDETLAAVPSLCENTRKNLGDLRRDVRTRLKELAETVRLSVKGR